MPPLTMRGRYLMREYWSDTDLFTRLTAEQRELYIGLWMLADDDGWLPRDVHGIAAALWRFEDSGTRDPRTRNGLARLRDLGKVESLRCGCLHLPAVSKYPRAGKKASDHRLAHDSHARTVQRHSNGSKGIQTDLNPSPVPSLRDPSRPVIARDGRGAGAAMTPEDLLAQRDAEDAALITRLPSPKARTA